MRVLIVHGWGASAQSNWFPWLKERLETKKIEVYSPSLPNSQNPNPEEWISTVLQNTEIFGPDLSIVAHSLGVITVLRVLERIKCGVGTVILVGGFTHYHWANELAPFFEKPINWNVIRSKANRFVVIESSNDPYVPKGEGEMLKNNLNAEYIQEKDAGHFTSKDGYLIYQKILDILTS